MSVAETKKPRGVKKLLPLEKKHKSIVLEKPKKEIKKKPLVKKAQSSKAAMTKANKAPRIKNEKLQEVVFLPSPASIRLAEKVELYKLWYENYLSIVMDKTARFGGYIFILLGAALASSSYLMENSFSIQPAAVVCSEDVCKTVIDENLPNEAPRVQFLNSLPTEVDSDLDISLQLTNASNFEFKIFDSASGVSTTLKPYEVLANNQYTFIIPTETLGPSSYTIAVEVVDNGLTYLFSGPTFIIPKTASEEPAETSMIAVEQSEILTSDATTSTTTTSENTTARATTTNEIVLAPEIAQNITQTPISLKLEESTNSSYLQIKTGTYLPSKVEVYAQLENFPQPIFLGLATKVQSDWIFSVSALDLPNLKHYIFASFKDKDNIEYQSGGVLYFPKSNELAEEKLDVELALLVQKVNLSLVNLDSVAIDRSSYFSTLYKAEESPFISLFDSEAQLLPESVLKIIDQDLTENELVLNSLFQFYASAVLGGNPYLVDIASRELQMHYEDLSTRISNRLNDPSLVTTLNSVLSHRYQLIMSRIIANEESIKLASNNLSSTDSDGDGLSDYDELAVYKTSPTKVDSDNNAVIDAIEIVKNLSVFAPNIENQLAENNLKSAFLNNNVVSIKSISSVINVSPSGEQVAYALIEGQSLPNSHVFISLANSPLLGIIKTNNQGEFSYTLENELADDEYSLTASLFDGNGRAIVNSQPYNFTKRTNEFVAAGIASQQPTFTDNLSFGNTTPYYVTASVGVMAFGLILLLLSLSLRIRNERVVKLPSRS